MILDRPFQFAGVRYLRWSNSIGASKLGSNDPSIDHSFSLFAESNSAPIYLLVRTITLLISPTLRHRHPLSLSHARAPTKPVRQTFSLLSFSLSLARSLPVVSLSLTLFVLHNRWRREHIGPYTDMNWTLAKSNTKNYLIFKLAKTSPQIHILILSCFQ